MTLKPETLDDMWALADTALKAGLGDRTHPARHPVLATISPTGPQLRVLVLRGWNGRDIRLQTDAATAKVDELRHDPRCALHIWLPDQMVQLRLSGDAKMTAGSAMDWERMPAAAQHVYGGAPAPGTQSQSQSSRGTCCAYPRHVLEFGHRNAASSGQVCIRARKSLARLQERARATCRLRCAVLTRPTQEAHFAPS